MVLEFASLAFPQKSGLYPPILLHSFTLPGGNRVYATLLFFSVKDND